MGGVVNIISNRPTDIPEGTYGSITGGFGNQAQGIGEFDVESRSGLSEFFLSANTYTTNRGLDAPTYVPINDESSNSDQFFRFITQLTPRSTLAFDYSNQFSQFQIPINTDPNNPLDPIVSAPGTLDTQLEYERFSNLNWTQSHKTATAIFQVIPWWRSTRIDYYGDLPLDVLAVEPDFSICPPTCAKTVHLVGLNQGSYASYARPARFGFSRDEKSRVEDRHRRQSRERHGLPSVRVLLRQLRVERQGRQRHTFPPLRRRRARPARRSASTAKTAGR